MGIFFGKPKNSDKPKDVFERGKEEVQKRIEEIKKNADPKNKRSGKLIPSSVVKGVPQGPIPGSSANVLPAQLRSYHDEALDNMRRQLNLDADAFLLNNILLSVQFFENYERETQQIRDKPISEKEKIINEAMIPFNKHVLFGDSLIDRVSQHVNFQRNRNQIERLAPSRAYVVFDNVEAKEPGDTSDYSAALDAPYYKLRIEECKEQGYLKLQKLEVLESTTILKDKSVTDNHKPSRNSTYLDSEKEFHDSDDKYFNPENFMTTSDSKIKNEPCTALDKCSVGEYNKTLKNTQQDEFKKQCHSLADNIDEEEAKPKKSILKNTRCSHAGTRYIKAKDRFLNQQNNNSSENEYGSSGYGSILSGGSTLTDSAIPKSIELHNKYDSSSGVLPGETWTEVVKVVNKRSDKDEKNFGLATKQKKTENYSSDEDDDEIIDSAYKGLQYLHEKTIYLNSNNFMNQFIQSFKQDLGRGLGFSQNSIRNAMTHGAKIYCDTITDIFKVGYEIVPSLIATWPNAANQWIIRERKIIQNPRNNFQYQWPVNYMVNRVRDLGCLLVPFGYRPKIGTNPDEKIQWRIIFPEAERYLESQLAHSHIRCYLFTLVLHKTFMENEMMIGIDAGHIKNHLFWQCEDNFAKWPEDRLGESLRYFLESFYSHFGISTLPNYFMESCNDFEGISTSVLLLLQRNLKDIIETLVMHLLHAIDKLKYKSIGFYPTFDSKRLFDILTNKNPLHLSNPNLLTSGKSYKGKSKKLKEIKTNITIPKRLEPERRHLVLKFFIPHFIAMARSSEKFDAINQAMIYLEQAKRLCYLLLDEPSEGPIANEYLEVICDLLADCQLKKAQQDGFKLRPQMDDIEQPIQRSSRQRYKADVVNEDTSTIIDEVKANNQTKQSQDSVIENRGIPAITIADIHVEEMRRKNNVTSVNIPMNTVEDIHKEKWHQKHSVASDNCVAEKLKKEAGIEKDATVKDKVILTNAFTEVHEKEQVQLMDNIIEESYL